LIFPFVRYAAAAAALQASLLATQSAGVLYFFRFVLLPST
jgi:hypothetical protein